MLTHAKTFLVGDTATPEKYKNAIFTLKTAHQMFSVRTTPDFSLSKAPFSEYFSSTLGTSRICDGDGEDDA